MQRLRSSDAGERASGVERYLSLLRAGGSDFPMTLLARAGVDLSQPETVRAVTAELDTLVARLEVELEGK
jgi:oligoendopeptidase F